MATDIEQIWKDLGLHHNQAKRLVRDGLGPRELQGLSSAEIQEKYSLTESMSDKVAAVLGTEAGREAVENQGTTTPSTKLDTEEQNAPKTTKKKTGSKKVEKVVQSVENDEQDPTGELGEEIVPPTRKSKKKAGTKKKAKAVKKGSAPGGTTVDVAKVRTMSAAEKLKLIQSQISKEYAEAGLIGLASEMESLVTEYLPTGFTALDKAMGGGWPRGKYGVIYGPEQTCKTTICIHTIAKSHRDDPNSLWLWLNAENSFDKIYAASRGVDLSRLIIIDPMTMEEQIDRAREILETGAITGAVVDSAGVWLPWQEIKKKRTDTTSTKSLAEDTVALLARVIGKFIRVTTAPSARTRTAWIIISHEYSAIGPQAQYMPPQLKGGNALKYAGHIRLYTSRRKGDQKDKKTVVMPDGRTKEVYTAFEAGVKIDKTRQSDTESHQVFIPFVYGVGLSEIESIIEMALAYGLIQRSGAYYWHPAFGENPGWIQGKDAALDYIRGNTEVYDVVAQSVGDYLAEAQSNINAQRAAEVAAVAASGDVNLS